MGKPLIGLELLCCRGNPCSDHIQSEAGRLEAVSVVMHCDQTECDLLVLVRQAL